jgi:predicted HicB family RNase H-like nuclease
MSASDTAATKKRAGRPATGVTKESPALTLDKDIVRRARKRAFDTQSSLSSWVEQAMAERLSAEEKNEEGEQ